MFSGESGRFAIARALQQVQTDLAPCFGNPHDPSMCELRVDYIGPMLWAAAVPTTARVVRRDSGVVMTREHFRILAAGECSAVLPVLARLARNGSSFRVLPFSSAEDVAMHLQYWTLDLLFVDADCTRVSAAKLCRALKEHPSTRLLPVACWRRWDTL